MKKLLKTVLILFIVGLIFFIPWYYFLAPKHIKQHWQEEVLLHNGTSLWVDREATFIAKPSPFTLEKGTINDMMVAIKVPDNPIAPPPPIWQFDAVPILLEYNVEKKSWIIIATYFYCGSWARAGRPSLATWQYIVKNNQWVVVSLDPKYVGRVSNLSTSFTNFKSKLEKITQQELEFSKRGVGELYKSVNGARKPNHSCIF